jgi:hypothetical protein
LKKQFEDWLTSRLTSGHGQQQPADHEPGKKEKNSDIRPPTIIFQQKSEFYLPALFRRLV